MSFKPDTFIAANDPGLAHAVARSFLTADAAETAARHRRVERLGAKAGSLAAWRAFFAEDIVAESVLRGYGDRALWTVAGYAAIDFGEALSSGHGLHVHAVARQRSVDFSPIAVTSHAVARMMARTLHQADRHLVKATLMPFFRAWWAQLANANVADELPEGAEVALCCPRGALLGFECASGVRSRWGAVLKTWVDAEGAADPVLRRTCADLAPAFVCGLYRLGPGSRWAPFTTVDTLPRKL